MISRLLWLAAYLTVTAGMIAALTGRWTAVPMLVAATMTAGGLGIVADIVRRTR